MAKPIWRAIAALGIASALGACARDQVLGSRISLLAYVLQYPSNSIAVVDAVLKTPKATISDVGDGPIKLALKPTGSQDFLYVLNERGKTVSFVNRRSGIMEGRVSAGPSAPADFAISPDGRWLFVTNPEARTITRINVNARITDQTLSVPGLRPKGIAVNPKCEGDKGNCQIVTVYVVSEEVASAQGTTMGKVGTIRSDSSTGMTGPTEINLNGALRPTRAAVDGAGNVYVTDLDLASGIFLIPANSTAAQIFAASPVGLTHDVKVSTDGTLVYTTIPKLNKYAQIRAPEGTAQLFPASANDPTAVFPEPLALNNDSTELWIGFTGSSTIHFSAIDKGRPRELRQVVYALSGQTQDPPRDIVLAGGI